MKSYEELEQELLIDPDDLDQELTRHVENYYAVSKQYMVAVSKRDEAKKDFKEVSGELYFEVRGVLSDTESRVTEGMVEAQTVQETKYQKANNILIEAEKAVNDWSALKSAYESRSFALRDLVQLYIAGYFGTQPAGSARTQKKDHENKEKVNQLNQAREEKNKELEQNENSLTSRLKNRKRLRKNG